MDTGRTDAGIEHLSNYTVSLLDAAGNTVWKSIQKDSPKPSVIIPVPGDKGRFIKIQLKGTGELTLAEVIVK